MGAARENPTNDNRTEPFFCTFAPNRTFCRLHALVGDMSYDYLLAISNMA
jgi:hypothetical protein